MDNAALQTYLGKLDGALKGTAEMCVFGSAACMLLGEEGRISLDVDIAGPYSKVDETQFRRAAAQIGLPVNPPADFAGDHIEWIGPLRLCLADPAMGGRVVLWQGEHLTVFTVSAADLTASKLIRYDPTDQADIQFLMIHGRLGMEAIAQAVQRLPDAFRADMMVVENLKNLHRDCHRWLK
ncbi:MAG: hypothetical protein HY298_19975 [Verrucomicrobia bacterium]|nr:hypothetical protein [Verrucomicrobiota bacterium]